MLWKTLALLLLPCAAIYADTEMTISSRIAETDRARILKAAKIAIEQPPFTITSYQAKHSEGGMNDFYSNGDYWWPDPKKKDGLPYINRDGKTNPENFNHHRLILREMRDHVAALAAAYRITKDETYVGASIKLLDTFFLDGKTRMNPHLKYAQAIPGVTPGRGIGIIDTLHLIEVPKAIDILSTSENFPAEKKQALQSWFHEYLDWMLTSKNGKDEAEMENNHGVCYWLQIAVFAEFTGEKKILAECRRRFMEDFVGKQMAKNGSFPRELARTKPYGYSLFQLDNMATLCHVLSGEKHDLWNDQGPEGRSMRRAVEWLYPYIADKSSWPLDPDVQAWQGWPMRQPALLFAYVALENPKYLDLWAKLEPDPEIEEIRRNVAITQPLIWLSDTPADTP